MAPNPGQKRTDNHASDKSYIRGQFVQQHKLACMTDESTFTLFFIFNLTLYDILQIGERAQCIEPLVSCVVVLSCY